MLITPAITQVSILSRRRVPQAEGHAKAAVIIQTDFTTYPPSILEQLKGADGVVWAQGISVTQVTKDEYQKITYDYPMAAAKAFATNSQKPFKFVYVSGEGATTKPGMLTSHFGVIKGRTELALLALPKDPAYANLRPYSLRPGGVDESEHKEIHEFVPEKTMLMKAMVMAVLPPVKIFYKAMLSSTRDLGRVLTDLAAGDGEPIALKGVEEGRILPNTVMRELAGL